MYGRKEYAQVNALLNQKLEEKKCLIAVHRGSWHGNIIQNTIPAYIAAIKMGAYSPYPWYILLIILK